MDKCNKCNGSGWIPYYETINDGYYKSHKECSKCDSTGKSPNKYNSGRLGHPGNTGFVLGKPPK
jgi:DnaJ-class molecular chaperone